MMCAGKYKRLSKCVVWQALLVYEDVNSFECYPSFYTAYIIVDFALTTVEQPMSTLRERF